MNIQDRKAVGYFFIIAVLIVVISLLCGSAQGATTSFSIATNQGNYGGRLDDNGRFASLWLNKIDVSRSARWDCLEGFCFRSNYQWARLAILRAVLPDTTKDVGTARSQIYIWTNAYWEIEREITAVEKSNLPAETKQAQLRQLKQDRVNTREKIRDKEAFIYDCLPDLLDLVRSGSLDNEIKRNGTSRDFVERLLVGALASVEKVNNKYYPTDCADSERF